MELSTESLEAACKLAYELGQQRANNDWDLLMKEASWRQLGSEFLGGAKALANRQTFQSGRQAARNAMKDPALTGAAGGFRDLARTAGQQMAQPFKNVYQTFRGKGFARAEAPAKQLKADIEKLRDTGVYQGKTLPVGMKRHTQATKLEKQLEQMQQQNAANVGNYGFGGVDAARAAGSRNYFGAGGALEGQGANIAAAVGAGALGTAGIYGAGQMVAGSPQNTYVTNVTQTQPQQAPHQYYLNQLSGMFS